jgi:hypothetical protein
MSANSTSNDKNPNRGAADDVRKAFAALSFDQKIATLVRVELDMLGDAVNTVAAAASRVADDIANAFSEAARPTSEGPGTGSANL